MNYLNGKRSTPLSLL